MRWIQRIAFLVLSFGLISSVHSADKTAANSSTDITKSNAGAVTSGATASKKVDKLVNQLPWVFTLDDAKAQATKENKPILWLHVLGDLDGIC